MNTAQAAGPVYALLADGSTVEIRQAGPADFDAVKAMHQAMSPDNTYLRFFNISRLAAETEARRICREPRPGHVALLALSDGEVVGCASFDVTAVPGSDGSLPDDGHRMAEVAFAVADHMHHRGIATLLLEHLVSTARSHQVTIFTAETLPENTAMLQVFSDAGLPVHRHYADGVMDLTFPLPSDEGGTDLDSYLNAVAERERRADTASLRHVLAPESVVVIGASRRRGTVGRSILDNIRTGGYAGRLYVVNPRARQIGGVALPVLGARTARAGRPGGDRRTGRGGAGRGRAVRPPGRPVPGGDHVRARHGGLRRPARGRAAGTGCGWSARTASAWPCPPSAWTPRSPPATRSRARSAWSCSPAAWASPWWITCPGSASGSPRSPRSATSSTCRATTC